MNVIGQATAVLAALIHVVIFAMESVLFPRPAVHGRFFVKAQDVEAVRPWAFNQGFYNLFLALGCLVGVILLHAGPDEAGRALIAMACGSMLAAALVLIGTDRRMIRGAALQGTLPLLTLILLIVG